MALETELKTYREKLPELLREQGQGKFVLIHDHDIAGFFVAYEDAISAGYKQFGLSPFLAKQILATEQVHHITRSIACPTSPDK